MFQDHKNERKAKNWKIFNQSFQQIQDQNQFNRSALIQQPKRYCPRKDLSKEKIFSKSKERFALPSTQITNSNSLQFKRVPSEAYHKQTTNRNSQFPINKDQKDQQVQTSRILEASFQHKKHQLNKALFLVSQEFQSDLSNTPINGLTSHISNLNNGQLLYENTFQYNIIQHERKVYQNKQNFKIKSAISEIREQFQSFKSLIIFELNQQKEFIRKIVEQTLEFIGKLKSQTIQVVNNEIQQRASNKMKNNSNDIRLQQFLKHSPTSKPFIKIFDKQPVKTLDFGAFQPQQATNSLHEQQHFHQQRLNTCKQSSPFTSADNFTDLNKQEERIKELPLVSTNQIKSPSNFKNLSKQGTQNKKFFEPSEQNGRYSEFLKKQYEQKRKQYQSKKVSEQQKISSRVLHLQKFNGAMQKLKSDLQKIKQIGHTQDIKKIKILEQKDQKLIQYPQISQLSCQSLSQIFYQKV